MAATLSTGSAVTNTAGNAVLLKARSLVGTAYKTLDCSHFVNQAYCDAKYPYTYADTSTFIAKEVTPDQGHFVEVTGKGVKQPGDVLLFSGHMGLWDPDGCKVLMTNRDEAIKAKECTRLGGNAPFLNSMGDPDRLINKGVQYGQTSWFKGGVYRVFRWKA